MKLKDNYITQDIDGTQVMVATGRTDFNGIVRSNKTAGEIIDLLKQDRSMDDIIEEMLKKYEVDRETITKDVNKVIDTLRAIGALEG